MSKTANYRGAVMGELELVSLSTGGTYNTDQLDRIDSWDKIGAIARQLKDASLEAVKNASIPSGKTIGIGAIVIGLSLVNGIVGI